MSNHIPLLTKSYSGELSDTKRDFKCHTGKNVVEQVIEGQESRQEWLLNIFESAAKQHKRNHMLKCPFHE